MYLQPHNRIPNRWQPSYVRPPVPLPLTPQQPPWWTHPVVIAGGFLALLALADSFSDPPVRACGICGSPGHNRTTCPHGGQRKHFSRVTPKSSYCECCGHSCPRLHRHHTRGRQDVSDYLDVCYDCHLDCCHEGSYTNLAKKPQVCRVIDRQSFWRT